MKIQMTLLTLALLAGCTQRDDPNLVAADAAVRSAESYVRPFCKMVESNPAAGNDQKAAAQYLKQTYEADLIHLRGMRSLYSKNPQASMQPFMQSVQKVKADRDLAAAHIEGALERTRADTFAPPIQPLTLTDPALLQVLQEIKAQLERQNALLARQIRGPVPPPPIPGGTQ